MSRNEDGPQFQAGPKGYPYHYTVDEKGITPPLGSVVEPEWGSWFEGCGHPPKP